MSAQKPDFVHSAHKYGYDSRRRIQTYAVTDCGRVVADLPDRVTMDFQKVTCSKCVEKSAQKLEAERTKRRAENETLAEVDHYPWGSSARVRALVKKGLLERDDESWRSRPSRQPRYRLTREGQERLDAQRREDQRAEFEARWGTKA